MTTIIVKHKVEDFSAWQAVFEANTAARREHGWLAHSVYRDPADPNRVVVLSQVEDRERAVAFMTAARETMHASGVVGAPEVMFLDAVSEQAY